MTAQAAESLARQFHEAYERLAPEFGYETRQESAVAWEDVPEQNKRLMVAVAAEVGAAVLNLIEAAQRVTLLQSPEDLTDVRFALAEALKPFGGPT